MHANPTVADDTGQVDEAESAMRKALGLLGETPRHRPETDRLDQPARGGDRFNGGLHRRRFVQDGDVPVTVLRHQAGHEAPAHRATTVPVAAPSSSRLQRTEAALAAETAGREKAERALADLQTVLRDLQTKIGHAELAKNEAVEALRREREAMADLRADADSLTSRLEEAEARANDAEQAAREAERLAADERHARKSLERSLHAAEAARDAAQQLVRTLSAETSGPALIETPARRAPVADPELVPVARKRGRPPGPRKIVVPQVEPEPVKWWLAPEKPPGKRR